MIWNLFKRKKANQALVERQYSEITRGARTPVFYESMGVPDTVMGRFELISIHMVLYLRRTASGGAASKGIAQEVVDAFFEDIDHSIRELGIGDMGVPKRMKKLARMFYGRATSYGQALESGDNAGLIEALKRNLYPGQPDSAPSVQKLADWMIETAGMLEDVPEETLAAGHMTFAKTDPTAVIR
ncbi:ubiquinol-cytochrome C chaperone family protein [Hoeflea sp. YIM 152468]|uniref:ubiquinol-cytochrome C chaperone family protein n=1 Tax=Hoeflea sp. YIM 152468 TaxID=3031759 RepID=UPI0023DC887B|nr:ubiquinol-cytochrome C chaperone family protein [Hoeflea sp. YIM 152468]MDF1607144.1 ubiquinol-cytochrome C chaperone family protein [Hoeflea sp. YIM 152468]